MKHWLRLCGLTLGLATLAYAGQARADGCYLCGSGSSDGCANYCRYTGTDNGDNRRLCRQRGCVISGTASCPQAANVRICVAPSTARAPVASLPAPARM